MSLFTQSIKNLVSGISQQPQILRHPEQLDYQENGMSTESAGLQKRPPTIHVKNLGNILKEGVKPLVHLIDRDEHEKYFMVVNGDETIAIDLKGQKYPVVYESDTKQYQQSDNPRKDLKINTVADYSFFVNTTRKTEMSKVASEDIWKTQGALVHIKSGQYGRTYTIKVDGVSAASHTTPDGSVASHVTAVDTNVIAQELARQLTANGYEVIKQEDAWIYFGHKNKVAIKKLETIDGYNNKAFYGFLKSAQTFSLLPATAPAGFTVEIIGEPGSSSDNYYVKFNSEKNVWEESLKPDLINDLGLSTMPHGLVREEDGTFVFKQMEWESRTIGDIESNPEPTFIGNPINDVFFFRGRLGVLSGENVILSRSNNVFHFWNSTATDVVDTDPIDISANHAERVCTLTHAVPFAEALVLFADRAQFVLASEATLTPLTARVVAATDFAFNPYAAPTGAGRNIYFASERLQYASVKEFYTMQNVSEGKNANDVSAHVPSYIPKGVHKFISGSTENLLLALTEGAEDKIYVYKYLFLDESRVQSSWSHWSFGEDAKVLGGGFIGSVLYLLIERPEGVCLEKMLFTYNTQDFPEEPYRVLLDRKVVTEPMPEESYDSNYDRTKINLHEIYENYQPSKEIALVTPDGKYQNITEEEALKGEILLRGDWRDQQIILGTRYLFKIGFSELMIKESDARGTRSETEGRLQLRRAWVNYSDSGYFKVSVEHFGKSTYTYEMTGRMLGVDAMINALSTASGQFSFPVQSNSQTCRLFVETDLPVPISLIGAGWEGSVYRRSKSI